jgi:hypothetical protein
VKNIQTSFGAIPCEGWQRDIFESVQVTEVWEGRIVSNIGQARGRISPDELCPANRSETVHRYQYFSRGSELATQRVGGSGYRLLTLEGMIAVSLFAMAGVAKPPLRCSLLPTRSPLSSTSRSRYLMPTSSAPTLYANRCSKSGKDLPRGSPGEYAKQASACARSCLANPRPLRQILGVIT